MFIRAERIAADGAPGTIGASHKLGRSGGCVVPAGHGRVPSTEAGDPRFISMVEQMVDRVLSRQSWPRPVVQGSQIVASKPQPEERN